MTQSEIAAQSKFNRMLGMLLVFGSINGFRIIISSFLRTAEQQAEFYNIGRRGIPGEAVITYADGVIVKSNHQLGLAIDLNLYDDAGNKIYDDPRYRTLGEFWKSLGGTWGRDLATQEFWHFELRT